MKPKWNQMRTKFKCHFLYVGHLCEFWLPFTISPFWEFYYFVFSFSFFLKSYFVFSLWSGYNTIIWWFFIYLFIYNFSWIWNTFSKEILRFYEVLTYTSSCQLITYYIKFTMNINFWYYFLYHFIFYWSLFTMCMVTFYFKL